MDKRKADTDKNPHPAKAAKSEDQVRGDDLSESDDINASANADQREINEETHLQTDAEGSNSEKADDIVLETKTTTVNTPQTASTSARNDYSSDDDDNVPAENYRSRPLHDIDRILIENSLTGHASVEDYDGMLKMLETQRPAEEPIDLIIEANIFTNDVQSPGNINPAEAEAVGQFVSENKETNKNNLTKTDEMLHQQENDPSLKNRPLAKEDEPISAKIDAEAGSSATGVQEEIREHLSNEVIITALQSLIADLMENFKDIRHQTVLREVDLKNLYKIFIEKGGCKFLICFLHNTYGIRIEHFIETSNWSAILREMVDYAGVRHIMSCLLKIPYVTPQTLLKMTSEVIIDHRAKMKPNSLRKGLRKFGMRSLIDMLCEMHKRSDFTKEDFLKYVIFKFEFTSREIISSCTVTEARPSTSHTALPEGRSESHENYSESDKSFSDESETSDSSVVSLTSRCESLENCSECETLHEEEEEVVEIADSLPEEELALPENSPRIDPSPERATNSLETSTESKILSPKDVAQAFSLLPVEEIVNELSVEKREELRGILCKTEDATNFTFLDSW